MFYYPTLSGGFILDDIPLIKNNQYIKQSHSLKSYFTQEDGVLNKDKGNISHTGYYRPLLNFFYRMDYLLWGTDASGYRLTNLMLHILVCFLLFRLILFFNIDQKAAFLITVFFALHPVNTEAVSWSVNRNNIIVTLFSMASLYYYFTMLQKKEIYRNMLSVFFFLCALFTKEFGVMLLPILFLYNRLFVKKNITARQEIKTYIPFVLGLVLYFMMRKSVTGATLTPFNTDHLIRNIYFVPYLIFFNIRLTLIPYGLHFFNVVYPPSMLQADVILSIVLFISVLVFMYLKRQHKVVIFSILSFLILLFPVLNIIPSAAASVSLVSMRWLYMPLSFLCIFLGEIIQFMIARRYHRKVFISAVIFFISYLGLYTYILNKDYWHDERTLFSNEVKVFKNDFFAGDLADKLFEDGRYSEAFMYFQIALEKYPDDVRNNINFSAFLIETGKPEEAVQHLYSSESLLYLDSDRGEWFNNMGTALMRLGRNEDALKAFQKSVTYYPENPLFWSNLGSIQGITGDYLSSEKSFKKGIELTPENDQLWANLALTYINMGKFEDAVSTIEKFHKENGNITPSMSRLLKIVREDNINKKN